jgi:hypothetical protein
MAVSSDDATSARHDAELGARRWRIAAWLSVAVAVLAHCWVARSAFVVGTPSFNLDEIASLLPGRALLGYPTPRVGGSGYFPLSAIVLSPIWWVTSDPVAFYRTALVVSLLIGLAAIWPLTRLATRLGLTTAQAVTVSGIVMSLPARTVQAEYVLAEKSLFLVLALTGLAVVRLTERPSYHRALLVSLGVALTYFSHARMLTLVVAALVWFLLFAVRHLWIGLVGLVSLGVLSWVADRAALRVVELVSHFRQGSGFGDTLRSMHAGPLARTVLGQSWEQVVSTFGLAPLGAVVLLVLVLREARRRTAGPALFLLLAVGAMFAGSTIAWATPERLFATTKVRLDVWIYGRYVDPLFALVALLALAAIVLGVRRWQAWAGAAISLAIIATTVLWLAPLAPTGGALTPAHAPGSAAFAWALPDHLVPTGIIPTFTNQTRFWLIASVVALVPVVVLLVARRRPLVVLATVLALGAAGTVTANVASGEFHDLRARDQPMHHTLQHILEEHPGTSVAYFWTCPGRGGETPGGRNRYAWSLLPTVLSTDPDADIVIACPTHPASGQPGAVVLPGRADVFYLVWIRPGPLQDELRAEGLLPPVS